MAAGLVAAAAAIVLPARPPNNGHSASKARPAVAPQAVSAPKLSNAINAVRSARTSAT